MRSFETGSFCSIDEYVAGEKSRLQASELLVDELYMIMVALRTKSATRRAAKLPSRVISVEPTDGVVHKVGVEVLDSDFEVCLEVSAEFSDGYWNNVRRQMKISEEKCRTAYLAGYQDPLDEEMRGLVCLEQYAHISSLA